MRVVDDDDHRALAAVEQLQQPGADGDRVVQRLLGPGDGARVEACRAHQLFDDPVGQQRLGFVAARPEHRRRGVEAGIGEEALDERGLAHPRGPFDLDHVRMPRDRIGQHVAQERELGDPPDEG